MGSILSARGYFASPAISVSGIVPFTGVDPLMSLPLPLPHNIDVYPADLLPDTGTGEAQETVFLPLRAPEGLVPTRQAPPAPLAALPNLHGSPAAWPSGLAPDEAEDTPPPFDPDIFPSRSAILDFLGIEDVGVLRSRPEAERVEMARSVLRHLGAAVLSEFIEDFEISQESDRVALALAAAAQDGGAVSLNIHRFGIVSLESRIAVAMAAARSDGGGTSRHIVNYGITDQEALIAIAEEAATSDGEGTSLYIGNYGIADRDALLRIARLAATSGGAAVLQDLGRYGIEREADRIDIAAHAAARDGEGTALFLQQLGVNDRKALFRIALIALAENPGDKTMQYLLFALSPQMMAPPLDDLRSLAGRLIQESGGETSMADALFADTSRRDVIFLLLLQCLALLESHPDEVRSLHRRGGTSLSRHLLWKSTGLDLRDIDERSLGERSRSTLSALALGIQHGATAPALSGLAFSPDLFSSKRQIERLFTFLSRFQLLSSLQTALRHDDTPTAIEIVQRQSNAQVTPFNIDRINAALEDFILPLFTQSLRLPRGTITMKQLEALEERWGDLTPLFTLAARFSGTYRWNDELPLLGKIAASTVDGTFLHMKYLGIPGDPDDQDRARRQLAMLGGDDAVLEWKRDYAATGVFRSPAAESPPDELLRRSQELLRRQVLGHANEFFAHTAPDRHLVERIKRDLAGAPFPETLRPYRRNSQETAQAFFELLDEAADVTSYQKTLDLMRKHSGQLRLPVGILRDLRSLDELLRVRNRSEETIVFTTTTDNPWLLLTVGDLVDVSSCQHYRVGQHIGALLGYVLDANVKLVVSYALTAKDFASRADFEKAKHLIDRGHMPEFIPARQQLVIGDMMVPLPRASVRRIIKLGTTPKGGAGIVLEPPYQQHHPAEEMMAKHVEGIRRIIAMSIGAATGQPITIPRSRNPGGVYSDLAGGIMQRPYTIP